MGKTPVAARCQATVLLVSWLSGCSSTAMQQQSTSMTPTEAAPARVDHIEIVTGATNRVVSLEEFVALQEIENLERLDPGEKLICRKERVVGTHFRTYRCFTEHELNKMMRASQDWLRAAQYWQLKKMH